MRDVSATFKSDVYKRSHMDMDELSTSQMFVCVYKVNIGGSKVSLNRISDYDKVKNFSINNHDWKALL